VAGFLPSFLVSLDRAVLAWPAVLAASVLMNLPWLLAADLRGGSSTLLSLDPVASFGANLAGDAARLEIHGFPALFLVVTALVAFTAAHVLVAPTVSYVFSRYLRTLPPGVQPKTTFYEEVRR